MARVVYKYAICLEMGQCPLSLYGTVFDAIEIFRVDRQSRVNNVLLSYSSVRQHKLRKVMTLMTSWFEEGVLGMEQPKQALTFFENATESKLVYSHSSLICVYNGS